MRLPALSKAKLKVQRVNCPSNLGQITVAYITYLGHFGGGNAALPYYPTGPDGQDTHWIQNLAPLCPSE